MPWKSVSVYWVSVKDSPTLVTPSEVDSSMAVVPLKGSSFVSWCLADVSCRYVVSVHSKARSSPQQFTASKGPDQQYWTDRRYKGNGRNTRFGRGDRPASDRRCYICGKPKCWSTQHTPEERRKAYDRYKNARGITDKSKAGYTSFLTWCEGVEGLDSDDEEDKLVSQYLQAINSPAANPDDDPSDDLTGSPFPTDASTMTTYLQDTSARHQLTKEDPFRGTTAMEESTSDGVTRVGESFTLTQYTETLFHGILPDTGAARISTGGQPQFLALQREMPLLNLDSLAPYSTPLISVGFAQQLLVGETSKTTAITGQRAYSRGGSCSV
ncbi:hypothetical protein N7461_001320 [Penicillium sp. DV-2018c]|nr:hypothetical protein N7461_001320 [Penicillium sp. DV-2018c]